MESFAIAIIFASLNTVCVLTDAQSMTPTMVPEFEDCTEVNYTSPDYALKCIYFCFKYGGLSHIFLNNFSCCICDQYCLHCVSAQGGYAARNIYEEITVLTTVGLPVVFVASAVVITNKTDFPPTVEILKAGNASLGSRYCIENCLETRPPSMFRERYPNCYCGSPLFGGCYNGIYFTGTTFAALKGDVTIGLSNNTTIALTGVGLLATGYTVVSSTPIIP